MAAAVGRQGTPEADSDSDGDVAEGTATHAAMTATDKRLAGKECDCHLSQECKSTALPLLKNAPAEIFQTHQMQENASCGDELHKMKTPIPWSPSPYFNTI